MAGRPRKKISYATIISELATGLTKTQVAEKYKVSIDTIERRMKEVPK